MTAAEILSPRSNGHLTSSLPWPTPKRPQTRREPPSATLRLGKPMRLVSDRVRARPAVSPSLAMNLGVTAIGLGVWGTLFPKHLAKTLGFQAPAPVVQGLFGLRELWTGYALAGDPTRSGMLWTRVAGDLLDIAVLKALDNPRNAKRRTARAALGAVLAVTALDIVTAVRMSNVQRNCGGHL